MRALHRPALLALVLLLALPAAASARDLRGKVGLGFNNDFSSLTSVSVKLGLPTALPSLNLQVQALVGFAVFADQDNRFFAGGRVLMPVVAEDNLNIYGAIGAGYARFHDQRQTLRAGAALGVEFFLFGLENLGLSAELGLNLDAGNQKIDLATTAGTAASVGVHYYFGPGVRGR